MNWRQLKETFLRSVTKEPQEELGLYIIYFKWYDTSLDTHEVTFDMFQRYILSGFRQKKLICPNISWEFGNFNDQNTLNLSQSIDTTDISQYDIEPYGELHHCFIVR